MTIKNISKSPSTGDKSRQQDAALSNGWECFKKCLGFICRSLCYTFQWQSTAMSFSRPDMSWACTWLRRFSVKISTEMYIRVRSERIWNQWVFWLIAREFCITSKWTGFTIDFTDFWKTLLLICITWDDQASPNHVTPK